MCTVFRSFDISFRMTIVLWARTKQSDERIENIIRKLLNGKIF